MLDFLPEWVKTALMGVVAVIAGLVTAANTFPDVAWLRPFRLQTEHLSEAHKARMRRRANITAGVELIGLGLMLPIGYVGLTIVFFNDIDPGMMWLTGAGALLCIGLGVWALFSRR